MRVLGFDAAGVVEAVGWDASLFKPGDEVLLLRLYRAPGDRRQFHVVDERIVGRKPASLTFPQAATMPLTTITAWELLFHRIGIPVGDKSANRTLLVINGAGGVGSILLQLARQLTGLTVIATASRPESRAWAPDMGTQIVIDHQRPLNEALVDAGFATVDMVVARPRPSTIGPRSLRPSPLKAMSGSSTTPSNSISCPSNARVFQSIGSSCLRDPCSKPRT